MPTRREFLAQSALLSAAALLSPSHAMAYPAEPNVTFPANPRDRLAVASYPFRNFIVSGESPTASTSSAEPKMELTDFAAHIKARFNVNQVEPWSRHFRSLEPKYLDAFRTALDSARAGIVNIAFDGEHSFYAMDPAERDRAVADNLQWIDAAAALGSPSIRTHIAAANHQLPDLDRCADTLLRITEHAASHNVIVHLENDDGVTEDPMFLVKLIEKVNSPWLRALPDFGNSLMHKAPEDAYAGIEAMFNHAYGICHVKPSESTEEGANVQVDLAYVFAILKRTRFRGYLSMEYDNTGDPYRETDNLIAQTLHFLA